MSIQVNKVFKDENVEKEKKRIQAQLPTLKNSPLILKELTKVTSFDWLSLIPTRSVQVLLVLLVLLVTQGTSVRPLSLLVE